MRNVDAQSRFEVVYEAHYRHVLAYARRRVEEQTARDIAAETFAIAWRRFETVPTDHPLAWLYATARRVLANELRSERYRAELTLRAQAAVLAGVPTAITTAVHLDHAERVAVHDELTRAMAQLSPRDQEVLQLISWEDLDPSTAAAVVGCSATTFKVRLHRARRRLREALNHARSSADPRDRPEGGTRPPHASSLNAAVTASVSTSARSSTRPSAPPTTPTSVPASQSVSHSASDSPSNSPSGSPSNSPSTSSRAASARLHSLESNR